MAQSPLKQPKRLFSFINYGTRTQYYVLELSTEVTGSHITEDDHDKARFVANYVGTDSNQNSFLDKVIDPRAK